MKPRELANKMFEEFLQGGQIQINPEDYPKEIRAIAITEARNGAALVIHYARRYREKPSQAAWQAIPTPVRPMVQKYIANRQKPAQ